MAKLELVFSIEGETQLMRRLGDISRDVKNWTSEFRQVGDLLLKTFRENFRSEGKTLGEPWSPLKASTLIEKRRLGFPPDILVRTGRLRDSFKSKPERYEVVVSNPTPYFIYHQSRRPRHRLPRRVMMKIDDKRKQLIVKMFQKSVENMLQRRSFK